METLLPSRIRSLICSLGNLLTTVGECVVTITHSPFSSHASAIKFIKAVCDLGETCVSGSSRISIELGFASYSTQDISKRDNSPCPIDSVPYSTPLARTLKYGNRSKSA